MMKKLISIIALAAGFSAVCHAAKTIQFLRLN